MAVTDFTKKLEAEAYEVYFENLSPPEEPWREFCEIDENVDKLLWQEESFSYGGKLEEWTEGGAITEEPRKKGYLVYGVVKAFARKKSITWHEQVAAGDIRDQLLTAVKSWARAVSNTKNEIIATMIEKGALTAGHPIFNQSGWGFTDPTGNFIYDGKPFFANDLSGAGGTDNRHPAKFDATVKFTNYAAVDLTYENLLTVYNNMIQNNIDDYGEKISVQPDILLVPKALEVTALQLVNADFAPHDSTTPSKPNPFKGKLRVISWEWLSNNSGWCLIDSKLGGIKVVDSPEAVDIRIDVKDEERTIVCSVVTRFGAWVRDWRAFYGCNYPQS